MLAVTGNWGTVLRMVMTGHRGTRGRGRRGAALVTTVLLAAVAATIVLALVSTTLTDLRTGSIASGLDQARDLARSVIHDYQAKLESDPNLFLTRVDLSERARVCPVNGQTIQPGSDWTCAGMWSYVAPQAAADARLEITPPSPADGALVLTAVARSSGINAGWEVRLNQSEAQRWTVATEKSLTVGDIDTTAQGISGAALYTAGNLAGSNRPYTDSVLAASGQVTGLGVLTRTASYQGAGQSSGVQTGGSSSAYVAQTGTFATTAGTSDSALDIRMRLKLADWTPSARSGLAQRWVTTRAWRLSLQTDGSLAFQVASSGGATQTEQTSSVLGISDGSATWVRVTYQARNSAGSSVTTFYTAPDDGAVPTTWTQVGSRTGTATSLPATTAAIEWARSSQGSGTSDLALPSGGVVYRVAMASGIDGPTAVDMDFTGSQLPLVATSATDGYGNTFTLTGGSTLVSSGAPGASAGLTRDLTRGVLRMSSLAASAESVRSVVCPVNPTNVTVAGTTRVSSLCLKRGASIRLANGQSAAIPLTTERYLLWFSNEQVSVYTGASIDAAPVSGSLMSGSTSPIASSSHPGGIGFWRLLGAANLPTSGVITSDVDVHLGICDGFLNGTCSGPSGATAMQAAVPVTVIAGSGLAPADVWVNGPISGGAGRISALAFGYAVFPYWAKPSGGDLTVDLSVTALGVGLSPSGGSAAAPVQAYPAVTPGGNSSSGTLTLTGTIAARELDLRSFGLFSQTRLAPIVRASAPLSPAFSLLWSESSSKAFAADTLCGNCSTFFGG